MQTNIKISLTIYLEGSTLVRKSEKEIIGYRIFKKYDKKQKKTVEVKKPIYHYPKVTKPASQHLNICKEAYEEFISSIPSNTDISLSEWAKMPKKIRIEKHLLQICKSLGGYKFDYSILDD